MSVSTIDASKGMAKLTSEQNSSNHPQLQDFSGMNLETNIENAISGSVSEQGEPQSKEPKQSQDDSKASKDQNHEEHQLFGHSIIEGHFREPTQAEKDRAFAQAKAAADAEELSRRSRKDIVDHLITDPMANILGLGYNAVSTGASASYDLVSGGISIAKRKFQETDLLNFASTKTEDQQHQVSPPPVAELSSDGEARQVGEQPVERKRSKEALEEVNSAADQALASPTQVELKQRLDEVSHAMSTMRDPQSSPSYWELVSNGVFQVYEKMPTMAVFSNTAQNFMEAVPQKLSDICSAIPGAVSSATTTATELPQVVHAVGMELFRPFVR